MGNGKTGGGQERDREEPCSGVNRQTMRGRRVLSRPAALGDRV